MTKVRDSFKTPDRSAAAAKSTPPAQRLGWLDALRGVAAIAVVFQHVLPWLLGPQYAASHRHFDLGIFGVFLFFLISGYIVPASLERRGDVRAFWVGRIFRIYPLYLTVFAAALILLPRDHAGVAASVYTHPIQAAFANSTLVQFFLNIPNGLAVAWTLSFEMVFYFAVSALFVMGRQRYSSTVSITFAAAALALGGVLPTALFGSSVTSVHVLTGVCVAVMVAALAGILSGHAQARRAGAVALGVLGLVLVTLNGGSAAFESMMILATMFAGTVVNRAESGQISRREAVICCGFVFLAGVASGFLYNRAHGSHLTWTANWQSWCTAFVAAWVLFGIGLLLRHRTFPKVLTWLGTISYATYLVHVPMIAAMAWGFTVFKSRPEGIAQGSLATLLFLAAVIALGYALHRLVELPGQRLGRRVTRRLDGRTAAAVPGPAPEPAPASAQETAPASAPASAPVTG
ncbi:acyltransferase family protein [Streptacidiphilus albus]|uniref:acyltransferase family protein n=1 Tax=Streptacidiphilus albus TaxID=105425 RepID=UPI00068AF98D|nr:acyltransferase [Streptacidiphilus albus]